MSDFLEIFDILELCNVMLYPMIKGASLLQMDSKVGGLNENILH